MTDDEGTPQWLHWARRIAAFAQNGLTFARDLCDRKRYEELRAILAEMPCESRGGAVKREVLAGADLDVIRRNDRVASCVIERGPCTVVGSYGATRGRL